jgi:hypothetical protein
MGRHSEPTSRIQPRWTRRAIATIAAAGAATGLALVIPATANAAGTAPSSTTVKASPSPAGVEANVAIVASVKILKLPGLGVAPTGTVTFSADTVGDLGSAPLDTCVLKTCKATLNTTSLPEGVNVITASWPGDSVGKQSSGTTHLTINETSYPNSSSVPCSKNDNFCDAGLIESNSGNTWADLFTDQQGSVKHTLAESLGGAKLKCADPHAGDQSTFSDTPDVQGIFKTMDYTVTDPSQADNIRAALDSHPGYLGCFAAHNPFISGKTGNTAPLVVEGTQALYEAPLPVCGEGSDAPCVDIEDGVDQYGENTESDVITIVVNWEYGQFGDPKYIG